MASVIDFLGHVILDDDGSGTSGRVPISEYVERAYAARAKCAWMAVAYRAVVNYVIAGLQLSEIRIRGSSTERHPRDYEEWLWNVQPNPNQNYSDFIAALLNLAFGHRARGPRAKRALDCGRMGREQAAGHGIDL